jgi:hypothetical protein
MSWKAALKKNLDWFVSNPSRGLGMPLLVGVRISLNVLFFAFWL